MICVQFAVFPAASVARYVLVIVYLLAQVWLLITSLTWVTTTPEQLSIAVTLAGAGVGTLPAQLTVTGARQVITGLCVSFTVTVNEQFVVPQLLVAVNVTVVTPTLNVDPLPVPLPLPVVAPVKA